MQLSRSARGHLLWLAHSQGLEAAGVNEVIGQGGLQAAARRRAGGFSLGMRQRLGIAAALLGDPPVLIFDEPFNGMDPEGIVWMRGFLRSLAGQGRAVLVSSHLMSELEGTADHLVIVGRGRVIADTPVAALLAAASGDRVTLRTANRPAAVTALGRAGAAVTAAGPGTLIVAGLAPARVVTVLSDPRRPVFRGGRAPGQPGAGLPGPHPGRGGIPGRGGTGGHPMSATTAPRRAPGHGPAPRDGFARVLHAEWTKFRTVRGWVIGIVAAAVVMDLLGLFAAGSARIACSNGAGGPVRTGAACVVPMPTGPGGQAVRDSFYFVHRPLTGNGSITVRVTSLTGRYGGNGSAPARPPAAGLGQGPSLPYRGLQPWSKAGIIIKQSTRAGSGYAALMVTGGHGVRMQYDYTQDLAGRGGLPSPADPRWLRLTRSGDTLTGYQSADGTHWTRVGAAHLAGLPATVRAPGCSRPRGPTASPRRASAGRAPRTAPARPPSPRTTSA